VSAGPGSRTPPGPTTPIRLVSVPNVSEGCDRAAIEAVRGRFAMKDRRLCVDSRGWGRSVHTIQRMPRAQMRNADSTMQAIVAPPGSNAGR